MSLKNLTEQLANAARDLGSENAEQTLEQAVSLALQLIEGCDGAGVTMVHPGPTLKTPVSTADWIARADALQVELQEGPCTDAVWDEEMTHVPDLASDERWSTWGPRVVEELGVRSMLCIQLYAHEDTVGALNLYSKSARAFESPEGRIEARGLAAHVAVAFVAAQEIEHLHTALVDRTAIGQAEGILMERFDIDADRAFEVLRKASTQLDTKLFQVASELVRTRRMPTQQATLASEPAAGSRFETQQHSPRRSTT